MRDENWRKTPKKNLKEKIDGKNWGEKHTFSIHSSFFIQALEQSNCTVKLCGHGSLFSISWLTFSHGRNQQRSFSSWIKYCLFLWRWVLLMRIYDFRTESWLLSYNWKVIMNIVISNSLQFKSNSAILISYAWDFPFRGAKTALSVTIFIYYWRVLAQRINASVNV